MHLIDIMATACEVSGAIYPAEFNGHAILPKEGTSLVPAFSGKPLHRWKPIFWEHEGNRAIRSGDWKAVMKFKGEWELYNIAEDRTDAEQPDQAASGNRVGPDRAMGEWAASSFVDPWIGEVRTDWGEEIKQAK